jgi:hypothetical protein
MKVKLSEPEPVNHTLVCETVFRLGLPHTAQNREDVRRLLEKGCDYPTLCRYYGKTP